MKASPHSIDDEQVAVDAVDTGELLKENKALRDDNKALHDRLLRALADAENTRRQADRSIAEAHRYAIADFTRELLTVVDNLQRTVESAEKHSLTGAENEALLEGVRVTLRAFLRTLERFGVRRIDALGKPFDPNFHEAVATMSDQSYPPDTVIEVVEPGYLLRDRLLRPARVVVSRGPKQGPEEPSVPEDNDLGSQWRAPIDPK